MSLVNLNSNISDRERLMLHAIDGLKSSALLCGRGELHSEESWRDRDGRMYVHFAYYRDPRPGDLVIAETGRIDEWKLSFYVSNEGSGNHVVRDINTGQLCNYSNESFRAIVGLSPIQLLVGHEFQFYRKVLGAFHREDAYLQLFGGLEFAGGEAVIWVRERWGGLGNRPSTPYSVRMRWTKRTTVKAIRAALRAGGLGWRSFYPWGNVVDDFGAIVSPTPHPHSTWLEYA